MLLILSANSLKAQDLNEETAKKIVVMIEGRLGRSPTIGAGIIVGAGQDRLYIVTANHLVRRGQQEAEDLFITMRSLPGERLPVQLLHHVDRSLDLAVLSLTAIQRRAIRANEVPFALLGQPNELQRGDEVHHIGNPNGNAWRVNVRPDALEAISGGELRFETITIAPGSSGGGLFNDNYELVGMVKSDQPPVGVAVEIGQIIGRLNEWGYPVNLAAPESGDSSTVSTTSTERTNLKLTIHRVAVLDTHCDRGDQVSIGYGYSLVHNEEMFLGDEMRPQLEHNFRNAEKILLHVKDCRTSGSWGGETVVTKNDLGRGIVSKQLNVGNGTYEVDYSVAEVARALGNSVQFPFRGRRYCEYDVTWILSCYDSLDECERELEEGLGSLTGAECRPAPRVSYCFEYSYEGRRYASCHTTPTACEGALGSNAEALTYCTEITIAGR